MRKFWWLTAAIALTSCQTGAVPSAHKAGMTFAQRQADFDRCKIVSLRKTPQSPATEMAGGYYNPAICSVAPSASRLAAVSAQ